MPHYDRSKFSASPKALTPTLCGESRPGKVKDVMPLSFHVKHEGNQMQIDIPTLATIKHLEDIHAQDKPIDADAILTDNQLERGGLVKVEAFMRTRTSAAAARKAKQRERDTETGLRQVNIKTTEEASAALKSIAAEVGKGATIVDAILKAVPSVSSHALVTPKLEIVTVEKINPETERLAEIGRRVARLTGWRRMVAIAIEIL